MSSKDPPSKIPRHAGGAFNPRKATAPIAAFCMAIVLYTYSVTSIRAAKRNAKLHREADGGQVDMRKESLRRHGLREPVDGTKHLELYRDAQSREQAESAFTGANKANALGMMPEEQGASRTEVESALQDYKGVGTAVKRFKEEQAK